MPSEPGLKISEIFYSIQGESTYAGLPSVFIRLAGCNLRCRYCDSEYSFQDKGSHYSLASLLAFSDRYPRALVELTGGEPLLQDNALPLKTELIKRGRRVLLETNGSLDISQVPRPVIRIMDLKCSDSGMCEAMRLKNLNLLDRQDEIKFVLSSRRDYDWAVSMIRRYDLSGQANNESGPAVLFSSVVGKLDPADLADWLLQDQLPVRLQLQLHKIIWPHQERGV